MAKLDKANVSHANAIAGAGIPGEGWKPQGESIIGHFGAGHPEYIDIQDLDDAHILSDLKCYESRWHKVIDDVRWGTHCVELSSKRPVEETAVVARTMRAADEIGSVMMWDSELYESLAQLAFAYPVRRILTRPTPNHVLNSIIIASVALQIVTITFPPLRTMLGLVPLDAPVVAFVAVALLITVLGAETWTRSATRNGATT